MGSLSYSLDERMLSICETVQVRKVRFHPGSFTDSHVVVLTSDNSLRLYEIIDNDAINMGVYLVGDKPGGNFPGSKTPFLDMFGDSAVDFDFGLPEISDVPRLRHQQSDLIWPIYILRGDFSVFSINLNVTRKSVDRLIGPYKFNNLPSLKMDTEACSIICLQTTPQIFVIAASDGVLTNTILLKSDDEELQAKKELFVFETIQIELGLLMDDDDKFKCPIFLEPDPSTSSRYFAIHEAGAHMIDLSCLDGLNEYFENLDEPTNDIFINPSCVEYLLCTRNQSKSNPIFGFALYFEPTAFVALVADHRVVTQSIIDIVPVQDMNYFDNLVEKKPSPLKKMLKEPFDQYIQKILRKNISQPLLKLPSKASDDPQECFELIQRTAHIFREDHFKNLAKAKAELDKRVHTLNLLKIAQKQEIDRLTTRKDDLRETAGNLAEKYEDIKERQDVIMRRCEELLMLVSRKKTDLSDAEQKFMKDMEKYGESCATFRKAIDKVKKKQKYQEVQIQTWKANATQKSRPIGSMQATTIRDSLENTNKKINAMIKQVNELKGLLHLK